MDNRTKISDALSSLLVRENEDAFVIVEHSETQKFVQFTGSAQEQLLLDLPAQTLSEAEFYRAVQLFREFGVVGDEHEVFDEPGGRVVGQQFSFNLTFRTVADAAKAAQEIFAKVYGFPGDCELSIIEN